MNKYIKIYNNCPVPRFSFEELKSLSNNIALSSSERAMFKAVYEKAKSKVNLGTPKDNITGFVRPETGGLTFTTGPIFSSDC